MSDLDTQAGNAFRTLRRAIEHVAAAEQNRRCRRTYVVDGHALELWSLKVLLGGFVSSNLAVEGVAARRKLNLNVSAAVEFLLKGRFSYPLGFYYTGIWQRSAIYSIALLTTPRDVVGIRIGFLGFVWDFALEQPPESAYSRHARRPRFVQIAKEKFVSDVVFAWDDIQPGDFGCLTTYPGGTARLS